MYKCINVKKNVLNWSNANDFHGSRRPTLRGLARNFYDPSIEAENQLSYCGSTLIVQLLPTAMIPVTTEDISPTLSQVVLQI